MPHLGYIRITPERLSALCVVEAAGEVERAAADPVRWFFAISILHRALNCALVAALRGSAGIGAYPVKGRALWIAWFEESRSADVPPPRWNRVEEFTALLARAQDPAEPEMRGFPLTLTEVQREDLQRLNRFRADLEHVKPGHWSLEVGGLPRICGAAAFAISHLFSANGIGLHLEEDELAAALGAIERIGEAAAQFPSVAPARAERRR
jgi:hypothetical protein